MILKIGVFASLREGYKLEKSSKNKAVSNQTDTSTIVPVVTTGFGTKISNVVIIPKEIPNAKLETNTITL